MIIVGSQDPVMLRHLELALVEHQRWCRSNGIPFEGGIAEMLAAVMAARTNPNPGQRRPTAANGGQFHRTRPDPTHDADVPTLTLTYTDAARAIGVSARTVRRLVDAGRLPSVLVSGTRRIRRADVDHYVENLESR